MWTYLNMPFLLAWPGVETEELKPWPTDSGDWRRLAVRFPGGIATHSTVQTLYFDGEGLLKRHDYDVEIAGNTPGAHIIEDYAEVSGIKFPTKRIMPVSRTAASARAARRFDRSLQHPPWLAMSLLGSNSTAQDHPMEFMADVPP